MNRTPAEWTTAVFREEFPIQRAFEAAMAQAREEALEEAAKQCTAYSGRESGIKLAERIRALKSAQCDDQRDK